MLITSISRIPLIQTVWTLKLAILFTLSVFILSVSSASFDSLTGAEKAAVDSSLSEAMKATKTDALRIIMLGREKALEEMKLKMAKNSAEKSKKSPKKRRKNKKSQKSTEPTQKSIELDQKIIESPQKGIEISIDQPPVIVKSNDEKIEQNHEPQIEPKVIDESHSVSDDELPLGSMFDDEEEVSPTSSTEIPIHDHELEHAHEPELDLESKLEQELELEHENEHQHEGELSDSLPVPNEHVHIDDYPHSIPTEETHHHHFHEAHLLPTESHQDSSIVQPATSVMEPKSNIIKETYIDTSDPHNPKEVHYEKEEKSNIHPQGFTHESRETETATSLNNPDTFSHHSSSSSSSFSHTSNTESIPSVPATPDTPSTPSTPNKNKKNKNRRRNRKNYNNNNNNKRPSNSQQFHAFPFHTVPALPALPALPAMPAIPAMPTHMIYNPYEMHLASSWPYTGNYGQQDNSVFSQANAFAGAYATASASAGTPSAYYGQQTVDNGGLSKRAEKRRRNKANRMARMGGGAFASASAVAF